MIERYRSLRSLVIAITALALSAGLAFGATPPAASWGLANAASHAGKTVPVAGGDETLGEDEESVDQEVEDLEDGDDAEDSEAGENCTTDPSELTEEELAEMKHGSVVCWAAHQTEWPDWFAGHGEFVRCWAHNGKADATSCTEDPDAEEPTTEEPTEETSSDESTTGAGHGKGQGKGKGKSKQRD
jgi:hypothetical protein